MAKLTKEQKIEQEKADRAAHTLALVKYKVGLPKRLMAVRELAGRLGVATHIDLLQSGPEVRFDYEGHTEKVYIDCILTYESEEWEVDSLEQQLTGLEEHINRVEAEIACAQSAMSSLTEEQRQLIKKHIHLIR